LRLQFRDPDHAASVGADKTRQQILKAYILRFHGVAAGREFEPRLGKPADAPGEIRVRRAGVKGAERLVLIGFMEAIV